MMRFLHHQPGLQHTWLRKGSAQEGARCCPAQQYLAEVALSSSTSLPDVLLCEHALWQEGTVTVAKNQSITTVQCKVNRM